MNVKGKMLKKTLLEGKLVFVDSDGYILQGGYRSDLAGSRQDGDVTLWRVLDEFEDKSVAITIEERAPGL